MGGWGATSHLRHTKATLVISLCRHESLCPWYISASNLTSFVVYSAQLLFITQVPRITKTLSFLSINRRSKTITRAPSDWSRPYVRCRKFGRGVRPRIFCFSERVKFLEKGCLYVVKIDRIIFSLFSPNYVKFQCLCKDFRKVVKVHEL